MNTIYTIRKNEKKKKPKIKTNSSLLSAEDLVKVPGTKDFSLVCGDERMRARLGFSACS